MDSFSRIERVAAEVASILDDDYDELDEDKVVAYRQLAFYISSAILEAQKTLLNITAQDFRDTAEQLKETFYLDPRVPGLVCASEVLETAVEDLDAEVFGRAPDTYDPEAIDDPYDNLEPGDDFPYPEDDEVELCREVMARELPYLCSRPVHPDTWKHMAADTDDVIIATWDDKTMTLIDDDAMDAIMEDEDDDSED